MRTSLLVCLLMLLVSAPASAAAAARSGSQSDPWEAPATLDGSPRTPDVEQVRTHYDSSGVFQVVVRFHEPLPDGFISQHFVVSLGSGGIESGYCGDTNFGDPYLYFDFNPQDPHSYNKTWLGVHGFEGTVPARRVFSADRLEVFVQAGHPSIAARQLNCSDGGDLQITASSCWGCSTSSTYSSDDVPPFPLNGSDSSEPFPVRAQCADGLDNDGDGAIDHPGDSNCGGSDDPTERLEACRDKVDNDHDGQIDGGDWGCSGSLDDNESLVRVPRLSADDAKRALRGALKSRVGRLRHPVRQSCVRQGTARASCTAKWKDKRFRFAGRFTVFQRRAGEAVRITVRGTLRRSKRRCNSAHGGCTKRLRVSRITAAPRPG